MTYRRGNATPNTMFLQPKTGDISDIPTEPTQLSVVSTREGSWLQRLGSSNAEVRRQALEEGRTLGSEAVGPVSKVLEEDQDVNVRELAISVLKSLKDPSAIPCLYQIVLSDKGRLRYQATDAICQIGGTQAVSHLIDLASRVDAKLHCYILATLGAPHLPDSTEYLCRALKQSSEERIQRAAARALGKTQKNEVVPLLLGALGEVNKPSVRSVIFEVAGEFKDKRAFPYLCKALVQDKEAEVRRAAAKALQALPTDWKIKAQQILRLLEEGNVQRSETDAASILQAIAPSGEAEGSAFSVTDFLIEQAVDGSEPMQPVFAELIIASTSRNTEIAGDRVSAFQATHGLPDEKLERLRIEIGGGRRSLPFLGSCMRTYKTTFNAQSATSTG
jgi:HEAT repeat protein